MCSNEVGLGLKVARYCPQVKESLPTSTFSEESKTGNTFIFQTEKNIPIYYFYFVAIYVIYSLQRKSISFKFQLNAHWLTSIFGTMLWEEFP